VIKPDLDAGGSAVVIGGGVIVGAGGVVVAGGGVVTTGGGVVVSSGGVAVAGVGAAAGPHPDTTSTKTRAMLASNVINLLLSILSVNEKEHQPPLLLVVPVPFSNPHFTTPQPNCFFTQVISDVGALLYTLLGLCQYQVALEARIIHH